MKISEWSKKSEAKLAQKGIKSSHLDSLLLLEYVLKLKKSYLLAHPNDEISSSKITQLNSILKRRCKNEPIAYIIGHKEFYRINFGVNKNVLIPRPESEDLVTEAINISGNLKILDVGTGCGAIAIAIANNSSHQVFAIDKYEKALKIAKQNANNLNSNVYFFKSNLLASSAKYQPFDVLVANLPYVPYSLKPKLQPDLDYEPKSALWVSGDGLNLYRKLLFQIKYLLPLPQHLILESLESQHKEMINIAQNNGYHLLSTTNLAQHFILKINI